MDTSALARRLSVLLPVALIIIQVAVFLILPDTIPLHVTDGEVTRWTDRLSIASLLMFFAMPVVTLIVASVVDRASVRRGLDDESARDRAVVVILFTLVVGFVEIFISYTMLSIV